MPGFLTYGMLYLGSALMAYNIYRYVQFARHIQRRGDWGHEHRLFAIPILLLVLFLAGYLALGLFGHPDLVISGILFGGSIFVFLMLLLIRRAADRIQENERLQAKLTAAEAASQAKSFFLSNMSHDIRTPLNAIIGYTTLAKKPGATQEEQTACLTKIDSAGRQLLDIVNDVLEMSRIENGKVDLDPDGMDLEAAVHEAGDLVRNQMDAKRIDFQISCDIHSRWVLCDKALLTRVLMNLLCNACKFTGEGGKVSCAVRELPEADPGSAAFEFRIKDNGIGMSQDFVRHLFTPFERERTSTVSKTQGTGLGMSITKSFIDMMGGDIAVETEQGKGTEYTIGLKFPLVDPPQETAAAPDAAVDFSRYRLLLAEDNAVNQEIACLILRQAGFSVETAENGRIAVDRVAASAPGHFSAVLMDIQMPVMDGYEAARAIRALADPALARVPIIAMTANAFQEDVKAAKDAGMNGHIAKPLDVDAMLSTLKTVLEGRAG